MAHLSESSFIYALMFFSLLFQELEKKVSQTTPFKNLKQMLVKKNGTLKDLRRRLAKYVFIFFDRVCMSHAVVRMGHTSRYLTRGYIDWLFLCRQLVDAITISESLVDRKALFSVIHFR